MGQVETGRVVVTLVHGTFARNAAWAKESSALSKALTSSGAVLRRFRWSGWNSESHRVEAAARLAAQIELQDLEFPNARQVVIAHSHGGNIAVRSLGDERASRLVASLICLNTPFVTATRRHTDNVIGLAIGAYAFGAAFATLAWVLLVALYGVSELNLFVVGFGPQSGSSVLWVAVLALLLLADWSGWRLLLRRDDIDRWFRRRRERMIEQTGLPDVGATRIVCIANASDEVYGSFFLAEAIANLPHEATHVVLVGVFFLAAFVGFSGETHFDLAEIWWGWLDGNPAIMLEVVVVGGGLAAKTGYFALFATTAYVILMTALGVVLSFLLRILPMGFDWRTLFDSIFVKLSFSPVPVTARDVEFRGLALEYRPLNHSAVYQDAAGIAVITESVFGEATKECDPVITEPKRRTAFGVLLILTYLVLVLVILYLFVVLYQYPLQATVLSLFLLACVVARAILVGWSLGYRLGWIEIGRIGPDRDKQIREERLGAGMRAAVESFFLLAIGWICIAQLLNIGR